MLPLNVWKLPPSNSFSSSSSSKTTSPCEFDPGKIEGARLTFVSCKTVPDAMSKTTTLISWSLGPFEEKTNNTFKDLWYTIRRICELTRKQPSSAIENTFLSSAMFSICLSIHTSPCSKPQEG